MPVAVGRTVSVSLGAVSLTVAGAFVVPYQVKPQPNWVTDVDVRGKSATGYVLDFTVPAPASAAVDLAEVQAG